MIINNINTNNNTNNNKVAAGATPSSDEDDTMEQFFWNVSLGLSQANDTSIGDFKSNLTLGFWYFLEQPYRSSVVIGAALQSFAVNDDKVTQPLGEASGAPSVGSSYAYLGYSFPEVFSKVSVIPFYGVGSGRYKREFTSLSGCASCTAVSETDYAYSVLGVRFFDVGNARHGRTWYVELQHSRLSYDRVRLTVKSGSASSSNSLSASSDDTVNSIILGFAW